MKIKHNRIELIHSSKGMVYSVYLPGSAPRGTKKFFSETDLSKLFLEYEMEHYEIQDPSGETIDMKRFFDFQDTELCKEIIIEYYSVGGGTNG